MGKADVWSHKIVGAAALFGAYALYAGTKIPDFKEITLSSPQINRKRTIVVLSDLHIHRVINPEKIKGIVAKTNAQNPDIILLAGDVIDDNVKSVSSTISLLKGLKAKEGIYFVTGNHEFYDGYKPTVETLKKLGFTFLENGGVSLEDIYIAGIPDTFSGHFYGKNDRCTYGDCGCSNAADICIISVFTEIFPKRNCIRSSKGLIHCPYKIK